MKPGDRVIALESEQLGELVAVRPDGQVLVRLDAAPGELGCFDPFEIELVCVGRATPGICRLAATS